MTLRTVAACSFALLSLPLWVSLALGDPLVGRIFDQFTGKPIVGALITNGLHSAETDSEGHFSLPSSDPDRQIVVRASGYWRSFLMPQGPLEVGLQRFDPQALYLSFWGAGHNGLRSAALKQIEKTRLNALVIDVKGDLGMLSYRSRVPEARSNGAQKTITLPNLKSWLQELRQQGIYTIARVVVFKDDLLAQAHPEIAVRDRDGNVWRDGEGLRWVDPFSEKAQQYNLAIAKEAATLGFDEVMFDYIRFPDTSGLRYSQPSTQKGRVGAISGFLAKAKQELAGENVFTSAAIFGVACWNPNDTHIGQQLEALAPHVDILAPMLYPSGFQHGVEELTNPMEHPYEIIVRSLKEAQRRSGLSSERFRPWLQAFRDYAFDRRRFDADEIAAQVAASRAFGSNGWMLWNARNDYKRIGPLRDLLLADVEWRTFRKCGYSSERKG